MSKRGALMKYQIDGGHLVIDMKLLGELFLIPNQPLIQILRKMDVRPERTSKKEILLDFNFKNKYEFNDVVYENLKNLALQFEDQIKGSLVVTCMTTHTCLYLSLQFGGEDCIKV